MVVDINKVEHFVNSDDTKGCKALDSTNIKEKYPNIEEVSIVLDIKEMITKAIYKRHKSETERDSIVILGHQIDRSIETLYIIARYSIQHVEQIGVFVLDMLGDALQFELYYFTTKYLKNPAIRLCNGKNDYFRFICNFDLYKIAFDGVSANYYDVYYNEDGYFVSTKYNRFSPSFMKGDHDKDKIVVESLDNLIIIKYDCKYTDDIKEVGREYAEGRCSSSYALLLCDLVLVRKMSAVLM
jgi:hypothetical protein